MRPLLTATSPMHRYYCTSRLPTHTWIQPYRRSSSCRAGSFPVANAQAPAAHAAGACALVNPMRSLISRSSVFTAPADHAPREYSPCCSRAAWAMHSLVSPCCSRAGWGDPLVHCIDSLVPPLEYSNTTSHSCSGWLIPWEP